MNFALIIDSINPVNSYYVNDNTAYKFVNLGSVTDWFKAVSPLETPEERKKAIDGSAEDEYSKTSMAPPLQMEPVNEQERATLAPNPHCKEAVCSPSFWVPERGLCIYCGYRK